jgi:hypothetical protein
MLSVGMLGCGGSSSHHVDGAPDTPPDISGSTTLTITAYRTAGPVNAQLVAVQDGDGAWTALSGSAGVYTTTLHSDRYGVMTSCATAMFGGGPSIFYASVSNGTTLFLADCEDPGPATAYISGTLTGAAAPIRFIVDAFFGVTDVPAGTTTYAASTLVGSQRLIAEELVNGRPVKLATNDANVVDSATLNFDSPRASRR